MLLDAVTAGAGPALRAVRGQISPFVKGRLTRNLGRAIDELAQDASFLADDVAKQGTKIHKQTAALMRNEGIPGLRSSAPLCGMASAAGWTTGFDRRIGCMTLSLRALLLPSKRYDTTV